MKLSTRLSMFVAVAVLTTSNLARADELVLHLGSWHSEKVYNSTKFDRPKSRAIWKEYNNLNLGLGYTFHTDNPWTDNVTLGLFHNSHFEPSLYVAKTVLWDSQVMIAERPVQYGAFAMLATGYKSQTRHAISGSAGFSLKVPVTAAVSTNVIVIPKTRRHDSNAVAHFSLGYDF